MGRLLIHNANFLMVFSEPVRMKNLQHPLSPPQIKIIEALDPTVFLAQADLQSLLRHLINQNGGHTSKQLCQKLVKRFR